MPNLSLTSFFDFILKTGKPRVTLVKNIKKNYNDPYSVEKDFYLLFRNHIKNVHRKGLPKTQIDTLIQTLNDSKKLNNYPELIHGYKKWWGRKTISWIEPPQSTLWGVEGIDIHVNPELCLEVNGTRHLIKLYMKNNGYQDILSKKHTDIITYIMKVAFQNNNATMSVLNIRKSKFYSLNSHDNRIDPLINAELEFIKSLWNQV
jgi:hypothetical protein